MLARDREVTFATNAGLVQEMSLISQSALRSPELPSDQFLIQQKRTALSFTDERNNYVTKMQNNFGKKKNLCNNKIDRT